MKLLAASTRRSRRAFGGAYKAVSSVHSVARSPAPEQLALIGRDAPYLDAEQHGNLGIQPLGRRVAR